MQLQGKRIVVTGGSKGIGASVVKAYAAAGAHVESFARNATTGQAVATAANDAGPGTVVFTVCDVSDRAALDVAFDAAVQRLGGLDALVHVAGVHTGTLPEDIDEELFDYLYRNNVYGTIITNQAAFRYLKDTGGTIVNFGSEAGLSGYRNPGMNSGYGPTKAAIHSWTRHVARDWGRYGIRVNAVLPYMWTPMYDDYRAAMTPEELAAHDIATATAIPLGGKFGNADEDLAPVMVFLASDASRFITGQLLSVDGGLTGE